MLVLAKGLFKILGIGGNPIYGGAGGPPTINGTGKSYLAYRS